MDHDGPRVWDGGLGAVDLLQEAEHSSRLVRHSVVGPTQVLVVPDVPHRLPLEVDRSKFS